MDCLFKLVSYVKSSYVAYIRYVSSLNTGHIRLIVCRQISIAKLLSKLSKAKG